MKSTQPMRNCIKAGERNVLELTNAMNNALAGFGSHVVTFDGQHLSFCSEQRSDTCVALALRSKRSNSTC